MPTRPAPTRFPTRFTSSEYGAWFALEILVGVELDELIDHLIRQIREVTAFVSSSGDLTGVFVFAESRN